MSADDDDVPIEETKRIGPSALPQRTRLRLMVMGSAGGTAFPLPATGEVVVGRATSCDVRIDDERLSRQHAVLRMGPKVELVDLGSANGTKIGGRPLAPNEPTVVAPGDVITFASTQALLQTASLSMQLRHVLTHAHFEARLADACARAAQVKRSFAVVRARVASPGPLVEATFDEWLRPMDVVAAFSPDEFEFLLSDIDALAADALVEKAEAVFERHGVRADVVLVVVPRDARTPEEIVSRASRYGAPESVPMLGGGFLDHIRPVVERIAAGTISVLIVGETGAGKEVLAHAIHRASPRADSPFVCLNCASFVETLLESELFGYERGAFTGAVRPKPGLLESADGGTVFLDEIGEMPAGLQARLLRAIELRQVQRLGALKPRSIDVRFLSATNRDLEQDVERGRFRRDLLYRLNGMTLTVPPLRDRVAEIAPLAEAFATDVATSLGRRTPKLSADVLALFRSYAWPGNIRELRNVIERAVLLCGAAGITREHVPVDRMVRTGRRDADTSPAEEALFPSLDAPTVVERGTLSDGDDAERERILAALERCAGNQTKAARELGLSRNTLLARLDRFGLPRPRKPA